MKSTKLRLLLAPRAFFYRLFAEVLYLEPREELLRPDASNARTAAILREGALRGGEREFFAELRTLKRYAPDDWRRLRLEYIRLFADPEHVRVCPWESVYLSHERVIFDEHTLAVQGVLPGVGHGGAGPRGGTCRSYRDRMQLPCLFVRDSRWVFGKFRFARKFIGPTPLSQRSPLPVQRCILPRLNRRERSSFLLGFSGFFAIVSRGGCCRFGGIS